MVSIGDGVGRVENGGFLSKSWEWDWGIGSIGTEKEAKICIQNTYLPGQTGLQVARESQVSTELC